VIQDASISVLVPFNEEAQNILVKLNGELEGEDLDALLTQSQQYVVNLYEHEVHALDRNGDIYSLLHKHVLALRDTAYSQHLGVAIEDSVPWRTEFS
jgi:CRISPR-associated endonuclease/helicase Cas3